MVELEDCIIQNIGFKQIIINTVKGEQVCVWECGYTWTEKVGVFGNTFLIKCKQCEG